MKVLLPIMAALGLGALLPTRADLLIQPNDRVMVAAEVPLNQGMASVDIADYFLMCHPVAGVVVTGSNEGQEEIEPFLRRIDTEIAAWSPTVALISHGNDGRVGREDPHFAKDHSLKLGQTLDALKKIGVRTIVLGSTSCVDSSMPQGTIPAKTYNDNLAAYAAVDKDLAAKAGVPFADVFTLTLATMNCAKAKFGEGYGFTDQGRYLGRNGQLVLAYTFLKALGCDGDIGTITVDLGGNTATGTPGQKIVSVTDGAVTVESTRFPFCFSSDPKDTESTDKIISCFPFNADLNRYLLVVNGLSSARAKVTWGAETREFASADLAKGVNLAEAFAAHTPFDQTFLRVQDNLWQQQLKQYVLNDSVIRYLPELKKMSPGAPFDRLITAIHEQDAKNGAVAAALFVPVTHTLKIEALP